MAKFLVAIACALAGVLAGTAAATGQDLEYRFTSCPEWTVDGSQVIEYANESGDCLGSAKAGVRVADFVLDLLCSIQAQECIHVDDMDEDQKAYFERLRTFAKPTFDFKRCSHTGASWRSEMITGAKTRCNPLYNGARHYDMVLKRACVMWGPKRLGCISHPRPPR